MKSVSLSTSFICDPRLFLHHWNTFETGRLKTLSLVFHDIQLLSPKRRIVTEKGNSAIISKNYLRLRSEFFQLFFHVKSWNLVSAYFVPVLPNMWKAFLLQYDFKNSSNTVVNHFTYHFKNCSSQSTWRLLIVKMMFLNDWCVRILKYTIFINHSHPLTRFLPFVHFLFSLLFLLLPTWFFLIWL